MSTDTTRLEWEPTGADTSDATDEPEPEARGTDRQAHASDRQGYVSDRQRHASDRPVPRAAHRATVAVLTARTAALEAELEHERDLHQQVVQRYERLLAEAQERDVRERDAREREATTLERENSSRLRRLLDRLF